MYYTVRRVSIWSAVRMAVTLGWLIALGPALLIAWLAVRALETAQQALNRVQNIEVGAFGQTLASFDMLGVLGLQQAATTTNQLTANTNATFLTFVVAFLVIGTLMCVITAVLLALAYNLLASLGGGLRLELRPDGHSSRE